MDLVNTSSKKNPSGKFVGTSQKQIIINLYRERMKQQLENPDSPRLTYRQMIVDISKSSGFGQRTIQTTLAEYKKDGTVSSPNKKKKRPTILEKVDDFDKNAIKEKIHSFWLNGEVPTISKILIAINEDDTLPNIKRTSFQKILKDLQFVNAKKSRNCALIESEEIITWRGRYLDDIRRYRAQNRPIYYLDEMWLDAEETHSETSRDNTVDSPRDASLRGPITGQKEPAGIGKRLIVIHIGSTDGFVPGGLLGLELKTNSSDYFDEINKTFFEWFEKMLLLLKENAVIVMDNSFYHSVKKDPIPTMDWKKQEIINWLEGKGEIITYPTTKGALLSMVKSIAARYDKYVLDECAKDQNKTVLRLPPYHSELNPMELVWSSIKSYIQTHSMSFQLKDFPALLIKGVEQVTPEMWKDFIDYVLIEEENCWIVDSITDDFMDEEPVDETRQILRIGNLSSDSDSD